MAYHRSYRRAKRRDNRLEATLLKPRLRAWRLERLEHTWREQVGRWRVENPGLVLPQL